MRRLYSLAWWLAMPLVFARLWWRGRVEPGYRQHLAERFGFYAAADAAAADAAAADAAMAAPSAHTAQPRTPLLWLHAVSVGETRAAEPLVDALLAAWPDHAILMTHMTPTGRATGRSLYAHHGARVRQAYLPYDTGWMVSRFLRHFAPRLCVLMETEIWPNAIALCKQQRVPVVLVNARLSARSLAKAERFAGLLRPAARALTLIAAQTDADALRLRAFGASNVQITGSIKFDVAPPPAALERGDTLRRQIGARPVLLCASTREGEEALILDAWLSGPARSALLLIVPRHPQRFDEVAQLIAARSATVARRSQLGDAALPESVQVLLGDSMGEMFTYYAACDVAFIGGSLLALGGQNLIEACAVGKPVLTGLHTFTFATITEEAITAGAAVRISDAAMLMREADDMLGSEARRISMGTSALAFAQQHRGATARTMALLKAIMAEQPPI